MLVRLGVRLRWLLNPIMDRIASAILYRHPRPKVWRDVRELPEEYFFQSLNLYPWLPDPLGGWFDFVPSDPDLFFCQEPEFPWFKTRRWGRDCDEWADLTFRWARYHGYPAWVLYLYNAPFGQGHYTCVYYKDDKYVLADYGVRGRKDSLEAAMELFRDNYWLNDGPYPKLRYFVCQSGGVSRAARSA